eukprot:m.93136 g.93136  ORF g.93136 m.93136 type:complete len:376 (+) comp12113_c0_seq1:476-1603(+)
MPGGSGGQDGLVAAPVSVQPARTDAEPPAKTWDDIPKGFFVSLPSGHQLHFLRFVPPAPSNTPPGSPTTGAPASLASSESDAAGAPPIVLVHGLGNYSANFVLLGRELASLGWQVFAPDFVGHGRSPLPDGGVRDRGLRFDAEAYVAQLEGFLRAVKIQRAVIVGHSMGGAITTAFAVAHPEMVVAVGLLNPAGLQSPGPIPCIRGLCGCCWRQACPLFCLRALATSDSPETVAKNDFHDHSTAELFPWSVAQARLQRENNAGFVDALVGAVMQAPLVRREATVDALAQLAARGGLTRPILLLWGSSDSVVPVESMGAWEKRLRDGGAEVTPVVIDDAGHVPFLEKTRETHDAIVEWLQRARGGSVPMWARITAV